jgi:hypothetical protein
MANCEARKVRGAGDEILRGVDLNPPLRRRMSRCNCPKACQLGYVICTLSSPLLQASDSAKRQRAVSRGAEQIRVGQTEEKT